MNNSTPMELDEESLRLSKAKRCLEILEEMQYVQETKKVNY